MLLVEFTILLIFGNGCVRNRFNVFYTMLNEVREFLEESQVLSICKVQSFQQNNSKSKILTF